MLNSIISLSNLNIQRHNEDVYKTTTVGTSDCNEYFPIFALGAHRVLKIMPEDVTIVEYCMPIIQVSNQYSVSRNYSDLLYHLRDHSSTSSPAKYKFIVGGELKFLNVDRGMLFDDEGNILLCLALKTQYILSTPKEAIIAGTPADKFALFITDKLDNEIYKNVKKRLVESYINVCEELNIDIIKTRRLNSWIFNNNVEKRKFKNVTDMKKHLREEVPQMILEL